MSEIPKSAEDAKKRLRRKLEVFPSLPDEAFVDLKVVSTLLDRSPATIWRDVANGRILKPQKVGSSSKWRVGYVRSVISGVHHD